MPELSKDQIAQMVAERIHGPIRELFEAVERTEPDLNAERHAFEDALVWAVAEAVFEASNDGVTEHHHGRKFMSIFYDQEPPKPDNSREQLT